MKHARHNATSLVLGLPLAMLSAAGCGDPRSLHENVDREEDALISTTDVVTCAAGCDPADPNHEIAVFLSKSIAVDVTGARSTHTDAAFAFTCDPASNERVIRLFGYTPAALDTSVTTKRYETASALRDVLKDAPLIPVPCNGERPVEKVYRRIDIPGEPAVGNAASPYFVQWAGMPDRLFGVQDRQLLEGLWSEQPTPETLANKTTPITAGVLAEWKSVTLHALQRHSSGSTPSTPLPAPAPPRTASTIPAARLVLNSVRIGGQSVPHLFVGTDGFRLDCGDELQAILSQLGGPSDTLDASNPNVKRQLDGRPTLVCHSDGGRSFATTTSDVYLEVRPTTASGATAGAPWLLSFECGGAHFSKGSPVSTVTDESLPILYRQGGVPQIRRVACPNLTNRVGQTLSLSSQLYPALYIVDQGGTPDMGPVTTNDRLAAAQFTILKGLDGEGTISLESHAHPGTVLVADAPANAAPTLRMLPIDGTKDQAARASFFAHDASYGFYLRSAATGLPVGHKLGSDAGLVLGSDPAGVTPKFRMTTPQWTPVGRMRLHSAPNLCVETSQIFTWPPVTRLEKASCGWSRWDFVPGGAPGTVLIVERSSGKCVSHTFNAMGQFTMEPCLGDLYSQSFRVSNTPATIGEYAGPNQIGDTPENANQPGELRFVGGFNPAGAASSFDFEN